MRERRNKCCVKLPVFGALLRSGALAGVVVEDLSFHAAELFDVLAKVAGEELLTRRRVREAGMGQLLAVRSEHIFLRTKESVDVLCEKKKECAIRKSSFYLIFVSLLFSSLASHFLA